MKYLIFLAITLLCLLSCADKNAAPINKWELDTNTRSLNVTNPSYQEARQLAQADISRFVELFRVKSDSLEFYIKTSFSDEMGVEHMWVSVYSVEGDSVLGTVDNDPIKIQKKQFGDSVIVNIRDIGDFSVYKGDSIIFGDYLNQALSK